ncbi:hypothetical protein [Pseudonocardia sp.]|uniref:hypothetical protein n=1 Tax=Pseudonocardia sp. TaxID=60912 RepID=UPI003D0AA20B
MPDPSLLTPARMLDVLHEHGQDADSDFNDAVEVQGWFGWSVRDGVLTVTHMIDPEEAETGDVRPRGVARWRLVPIDDEMSS